LPYRFVHTADLHLDSPLRSLALADPTLAEIVGNATRQALTRIVDLCLAEQVDALLLAGDLHDGDQTSMKTARFLAAQLARLHQGGIGSFIIRGNHDAIAGTGIAREWILPDSAKLFGGRAEAVTVAPRAGEMAVAVHGISFAQRQAPESLLPKFKAPVAGAVNVALLHTSLDGTLGHDPYAPCSLAELDGAGFDYWALGHIHRRSVHRGRCTVVMPGMPQGRDINEAGGKSVTLVTIGDDRTVHLEEHPTSVAQFERVRVDLTGTGDWGGMLDLVTRALEQARDAVPGDTHLIARLHFAGATPLAWRLRQELDLLREEARDRALLVGRTWIEKIELACDAPVAETGTTSDPLHDLRRLIAADVLGAHGFLDEARAVAEELWRQLPPECRAILGADQEAIAAAVAGLAPDGAADVLARLHATAGI
jgi:DNA repair exonuclease SbcCD nuclease subunit